MSQYVANLNTVPPPDDLTFDTTATVDEELAPFLSNDFMGEFVDLNFDADQHNNTNTRSSGSGTTAEPKMDFNDIAGDFQFADFTGFSNPLVESSMNLQQNSSFSVPPNYTSPVSNSVSPVTPGFEHSTDEAARNAAEEDKRRRNTAASARFRVKKKQREQALEKTAKEMTDRVSVLETRIQQLETENTWLKGLITEKSSTSDINAILKKHVEESAGERSSGNRTDGVGTKAEENKA